jgi:hypothetical protein
MFPHPVLRALRGDATPQRHAQQAMIAAAARWRATPRAAGVLADLDAFATCRALAECPSLSALFDEEDPAALALAGEFAAITARQLAGEPLGQVAMRHFTDGMTSTLLLARRGNVTLALIAVDGVALRGAPLPTTADFGPFETWERVLAGSGSAELVERRADHGQGADLRRRPVALAPGKVICGDAERQSVILRAVEGCLVTLRLQRRRKGAGLSREYRLADGALVHQAAGNPRDSRIELMLALLGRMGRTDAAPLAASIATAPGSAALRWQALRECLALDTATGFAALTAVARATGDELAVAAGALRSQLIEAHPQLAEIAPCPA